MFFNYTKIYILAKPHKNADCFDQETWCAVGNLNDYLWSKRVTSNYLICSQIKSVWSESIKHQSAESIYIYIYI